MAKRRKKTPPRSHARRARLSGFLLIYLFSAALVTLAIARGYQLLRTHEMFAVETLLIEGASTAVEADLREQLAWTIGRNFFVVDLERVRAEAVRHEWVESAGVRGQLPDTLTLIINEQRVAGLVRIGDQIMVVAGNNQIIAPYDAYGEPLDLPVIIGVDGHADREAAIAKGLEMLHRIRATSLFFWDQIETLDLSDEENMIIQLRSVTAPIYLGREVITANIRNYLAIAHRLEQDFPDLCYIELGFPNQVAIMPKEGY